ncbi:MAG: hypothetical protein IVW54_18700 [Candidatus Binataceae bacterium]|nr:hypothetical protein [Candidatus Binataceae bacterium]
MLPSTAERVPSHTAAQVNLRIREQTIASISRCAASGAGAIDQHLATLDREWDIERTLEANAAGVALLGLGLGVFVNRRLLVLPALVAGFLLQHALQGWCPPVPIFRRLGVRTANEIDAERYALKALRGDFQALETGAAATVNPEKALAAATR